MRTYFMLHYDTRDSAMLLRDAELGKVVKALYGYCCDGVLPENLKGMAALFFAQLRGQFDRDREQYDRRCAVNRENIQKRWDREEKKPLDPRGRELMAMRESIRERQGIRD